MTAVTFSNPFRPGAGHMPPYLAGRREEIGEFLRLLRQEVVLENLVLSGLRGVGKTVLLDALKPLAIEQGWHWVGTDLSESMSLSEDRLAVRLMADLAMVTTPIVVEGRTLSRIGFHPEPRQVKQPLDFDFMAGIYQRTPGMTADKLRAVLEFVWQCVQRDGARGTIFVYDEAQNLSDHAAEREYPLSLMLDVFQSLQKKGVPFMLVLAGLPALFPKLVEARTFAERMFRVVFLDRLDGKDSRDAVRKPLEGTSCPVPLSENAVRTIVKTSGGYPYFLQFISREVVDVLLQTRNGRRKRAAVPVAGILRKLDTDFYAGRWARATDRQRQLLRVVARLENCETEFTVQDTVAMSRSMLDRPFGPSQVNQMFAMLSQAGLIYKNRHGKYAFAVPLLNRFILRQE
jgi:hypothetical protein